VAIFLAYLTISSQVFDIDSKIWSSLALPQLYRVSNPAVFASGSLLFVAGGSKEQGNPTNSVIRIDTLKSISSLEITMISPMMTPRTDSAWTQTAEFAYVAGGYTNDNPCEALDTVEQFDLSTQSWKSLPSTIEARGNPNLVHNEGVVMLLGGEQFEDGACLSRSTASQELDPVGSVEVLGRDEWLRLSTFVLDRRLRSKAIAWTVAGRHVVYEFGGQEEYDSACDCFPNVDEVLLHVRYFPEAFSILSSTPGPTDTPVGPPRNDLCTDALQLEVTSESGPVFALAFGNTGTATRDNAATCNGVPNLEPGVWFFVRGFDGTMTVRTCHPFTNFDTMLTVFQGSCETFLCVEADDDSCAGSSKASQVSWEGDADETYYILVHGWPSDPVGNFAIWATSFAL